MGLAERLAALKKLPEAQRAVVASELASLDGLLEGNPLLLFAPHEGQRPFFEARTPVVAVFAGTRFGKTTALVVRSILECVDVGCLPERLRSFRSFDGPVAGRIVCPDFSSTAEGVLLPALRRWCPKDQLRGGSFDRAWDKQLRVLRFQNGSWIQVMTYEQDLDKFGGAALHFVGYDEAPPRDIREECMFRLVDHGGYEMFAMTPLKANTAWIRREIYKKRESPDITVVKGSIHDNPSLNEETKRRALGNLSSDLWRRAREFGDFVDIGGLIYPAFEECVIPNPSSETVRSWDVVVGIDPGIRNAAFLWAGFDDDNVCTIFDELLLQDATVADYAEQIRAKNRAWIVKPSYVIDPAARSRAQVNAESVESALAREGIYCQHGQNQVEAGIAQVLVRLQHRRLLIAQRCVGLRAEADEYAAEDRGDGEFKPIKADDHRVDALRYLVMSRAWDPLMEDAAPDNRLGFDPTFQQPYHLEQKLSDLAPLGSLS